MHFDFLYFGLLSGRTAECFVLVLWFSISRQQIISSAACSPCGRQEINSSCLLHAIFGSQEMRESPLDLNFSWKYEWKFQSHGLSLTRSFLRVSQMPCDPEHLCPCGFLLICGLRILHHRLSLSLQHQLGPFRMLFCSKRLLIQISWELELHGVWIKNGRRQNLIQLK